MDESECANLEAVYYTQNPLSALLGNWNLLFRPSGGEQQQSFEKVKKLLQIVLSLE